MSQQSILRKVLLDVEIGQRTVRQAASHEITFEPSQKTGKHLHPVLGYIVECTALLEIESKPPQRLPAGSAFYEPADTVVLPFDNAFSKASLRFVAFYLLDEEEEIIRMLPDK